MTLSQLRATREAFWETAPSYEGRIEIWQALRLACECEDLALAQAIVRSANITVPTGDLFEGCYDELGNRYTIPQYCFSPPANLVASEPAGPGANGGAGEDANTIAGTDDEKSGAKGKSRHSSSSSPSVRTDETTTVPLAAEKNTLSPALERAVTVRLSTGTDLKLRVAADERIAGLRRKVLDALRMKDKGENEGESGTAAAGEGGGGGGGGERDGRGREIKFFFLGRVLDDKISLRELKLPNTGGIVQALLPAP